VITHQFNHFVKPFIKALASHVMLPPSWVVRRLIRIQRII